MAKRTITFSLDVEASGPIPGPWWMCSFGICRTDEVDRGFARELQPLVIPGVSRPDSPAALQVVAEGVQGLSWNTDLTPEENAVQVRAHFEKQGVPPRLALQDLRSWMQETSGRTCWLE